MKPKKIKARRMWMQEGIEREPWKDTVKRVYTCNGERVFNSDAPVAVLDVSDPEALVEQAAQAQVATCNVLFPDWSPNWAEIARAREYVRAGLESLGIIKPRRKRTSKRKGEA